MRDLFALPKAHLHVHLEGAMRPATLTEMAQTYGVEVPPITGFGSFTEFSGMYLAACQVVIKPEDLARIVDEVVEDAKLAGAAYVEPSFYAPHHNDRLGATEAVVEMVLDFLAASAERHGIAAGLMLAGDRTIDPSDAVEQAKIAVRYADRGIVAFGLANDEAIWPPEPFAEAFAIAREGGLLSTPHAGELAGPASVRGALDALKADRVQHGVRAIEDPELVKRLADEGVCCDVCPTSNVLLSVVPTMAASALGPLLDAGVPCSVNADDPLLFGPGLLEEYEVCRTELGFDDDRMAHIARCSIEHSGAADDVKASALAGVAAWLAS
ncbi:MAG: adenosine deaminase [Acidimicrobiales bacterium]|nr:adenosine deaminase [Acidimicrobiales bacterium]